ncbi:hypothetical protein EYY60_14455 [Flavobacterium zhairuonense]|uniref:hypothetical protein n=1 Tax=Flavobacterium zhairuonense TaxID=2493631 RepID=UPI001045197E|nr:hypothetical protein [Flavobacterium zhairuonense]KAF2508328.1 hypothetical protein EYY60_14455 [Flavobacterium zhairuonense]
MKKILTLFAVIGLIAFSSCEGPEGPPGEPGLIGAVYENKAPNFYNFTTNNQFSVRFNFPVALYDSDVVLVYRYDGLDNGGRPVWQALPETYFFDDGTRDFSFKYVFTYNYVNIYLDGNNLNDPELDAYRLNQIFRIVVVPADFVNKVDKTNYLDVMKTLKLNENQVKDINF